MIGAELKARVTDPDRMLARLRHLAPEEPSTYRDIYYDSSGRELTSQGRELRLRVVETETARRVLLTYKAPVADEASGSKPEYETAVADAAVLDVILRALGMEHMVAFEKRCKNYRFTARSRDMLATLTTVPDIDGVFIELETMADEAELVAALADVRAILGKLGITEDDLTAELYTDAVIRARA